MHLFIAVELYFSYSTERLADIKKLTHQINKKSEWPTYVNARTIVQSARMQIFANSFNGKSQSFWNPNKKEHGMIKCRHKCLMQTTTSDWAEAQLVRLNWLWLCSEEMLKNRIRQHLLRRRSNNRGIILMSLDIALFRTSLIEINLLSLNIF